MPTEAQWEKACRGTEGWVYPWGNDSADPSLFNYYYSGPIGMIEVGGYPPGANGLYDMAGNAYEWTADWYDSEYYANSPSENPQGPESGEYRTLRGGSWYVGRVSLLRCASHHLGPPGFGGDVYGLRVVSPGF